MSGFKRPTNQPHIIDVEDEDNPEEETDKITTMGEFKIPPARPHIINVESDNSEDETDEPAQTADTPDELFEQDDALPTTPRATTEEAAPIPPHERLHRSRYLVKVCGYVTHGIWCNCPFIPKPSPRYHMETNLNVPQTLPIKPRTSDKIEQEEWDKVSGVHLREMTSKSHRTRCQLDIISIFQTHILQPRRNQEQSLRTTTRGTR
jgi:hypothetical protein